MHTAGRETESSVVGRMAIRDLLKMWKPKEGTLPPGWAIWLTLVVVGFFGVPVSCEATHHFRLWGDEDSAPEPTPVVSATFSNVQWEQKDETFALSADYVYNGPLPAPALMTVVNLEPFHGLTAFWLRLKNRTGTLSWRVSCLDIFRQLGDRAPPSGTALEVAFEAGFYHDPGPPLRPPTRLTCIAR